MAIKTVNEESLVAIGDAIRAKTGLTKALEFPGGMIDAVDSIETVVLPEEAYTISGSCKYRFSSDNWNWFLELFKDKLTTKDINDTNYMFQYSANLKEIPFDLHLKGQVQMAYTFDGCNKLETSPKFVGAGSPINLTQMFGSCYNLREVSGEEMEANLDWYYIDAGLSGSYSNSMSNMFSQCFSLRKAPVEIFKHGNPNIYAGYSNFTYAFYCCASLDEILDMPLAHGTFTANAVNGLCSKCKRLKNLTFELDENGNPQVKQWKSQILDLTDSVGYGAYNAIGDIIHHNSGITADKQVSNDATYQALKNDPDWFSGMEQYSRYNHDSAVNTINTLPDTSAYLATAGGTNTIKFKGVAGSKTDGGAINTLTAEEIAVATSKGWTVSFA